MLSCGLPHRPIYTLSCRSGRIQVLRNRIHACFCRGVLIFPSIFFIAGCLCLLTSIVIRIRTLCSSIYIRVVCLLFCALSSTFRIPCSVKTGSCIICFRGGVGLFLRGYCFRISMRSISFWFKVIYSILCAVHSILNPCAILSLTLRRCLCIISYSLFTV